LVRLARSRGEPRSLHCMCQHRPVHHRRGSEGSRARAPSQPAQGLCQNLCQAPNGAAEVARARSQDPRASSAARCVHAVEFGRCRIAPPRPHAGCCCGAGPRRSGSLGPQQPRLGHGVPLGPLSHRGKSWLLTTWGTGAAGPRYVALPFCMGGALTNKRVNC
jgi:hypothetical protein